MRGVRRFYAKAVPVSNAILQNRFRYRKKRPETKFLTNRQKVENRLNPSKSKQPFSIKNAALKKGGRGLKGHV